MDCTALFAEAVSRRSAYQFADIRNSIHAQEGLQCGDWDEWADIRWYRLCPVQPVPYSECYGFICAAFPVALLTENCPAKLRQLLDENGILCAVLDEPMRCDEQILRQYVPHKIIFDERFLDGEYDIDDERFQLVLNRLETGHKNYIDAGSFTMEEIR